jgi:hypothetical protein
MKSARLYIYPKDVMHITGKSLRTAQAILRRVKRAIGKLPHQPITFREFADYMNIRLEDVGPLE